MFKGLLRGLEMGCNMRIIRVLIISLVVGLSVGYLVAKIESSEIIKETNQGIKTSTKEKEITGKEKQESEENEKRKTGEVSYLGASTSIDITEQIYKGEFYQITVQEPFTDINRTLSGDMLQYYEMLERALNQEQQKKEGKEQVRLKLGEGTRTISIEMSVERYDNIEYFLGEEYFKEHLKEYGMDLLNNADTFWISEPLQDELSREVFDNINWENQQQKY